MHHCKQDPSGEYHSGLSKPTSIKFTIIVFYSHAVLTPTQGPLMRGILRVSLQGKFPSGGDENPAFCSTNTGTETAFSLALTLVSFNI